MSQQKANFVYKCIRVKDVKRPLKTRCQKRLSKFDKSGLLCDKCLTDAKAGKIAILMCGDVQKIFNIPFKNQVYVWIDISGKGKIEDMAELNRLHRNKVWNKFDDLKISELEKFITTMKIIDKDKLSKLKNEKKDMGKYRFAITKYIVEFLEIKGK